MEAAGGREESGGDGGGGGGIVMRGCEESRKMKEALVPLSS